MNSFMNLYNVTLQDLQNVFRNQNEEEDILLFFCRDLLKRTIFWAFYIENLELNSPFNSIDLLLDEINIISNVCELSHFKEIADIFFPLSSKRIKTLGLNKRKIVNKTLQNFLDNFSWKIDLKSQSDNKIINPIVFEKIYHSESLNNPAMVHTPYIFANWMVQSCFQQYLARILKIANFSLENLDSIKGKKLELLKKTISQIQVLDISVGSGAFYLAALDFLIELNVCLFQLKDKSSFFYMKKILKKNLYGLDIDDTALVISKIRLTLRILRENPIIQINELLEILTNINLKNGNSLVGFTTNPRKEAFPEKIDFDKIFLSTIEKDLINSQAFIENQKIFHWFIEFPKVFNVSVTSGFDIIIGNPPYIGYRFISDETKGILKTLYPTIYTGLNDYYYYFIWRAKQLLAPKGNCVLIVARYFLEARYAQKLRSKLLESNCIDIIVDFREFKIFPRGINSAILFMTRYNNSKKQIPIFILKNHKISSRTVLKELKIGFETLHSLKKPNLQIFDLIQAETRDEQFLLVSSTLNDLLNRIENQGVPLNQVCDIGTGYHSGKDIVFSPNVIEENGGFFVEVIEDNTIDHYPLEKEVIKRIVKTSDILPFRINEWKKRYVIFTKQGININDFPLTKHYLEKYKKILNKRYEVKKNLAKWYEIAQVRNLGIYNAQNKIICPYRSRVPRFALDKNQRYSSIDCTSLSPKKLKFSNIYFILGVLNSELIEFYLYAIAKKLDAQKIELYPKTVSKIPLKIPHTKEENHLYKEIIKTTKKICQTLQILKLTPKDHQILLNYGKKGLSKIKKESQGLQMLTEILDMLVYQLYDMETEIEILKSEIIR